MVSTMVDEHKSAKITATATMVAALIAGVFAYFTAIHSANSKVIETLKNQEQRLKTIEDSSKSAIERVNTINKKLPGLEKLLDYFPIGTVIPYAGDLDNIPLARDIKSNGWLICNGGDIPQGKEFDKLRSVMNNKFGINKLPDFRGRTPIGVRKNGNDDWLSLFELGKMRGEEKHQLIIDEMPSHNHKVRSPVSLIGIRGTTTHYGFGTAPGGLTAYEDPLENTGGGLSHENMQPSLAINFLIKAR